MDLNFRKNIFKECMRGEMIYLWFNSGILIIQTIFKGIYQISFSRIWKITWDESQKTDQCPAYFVSLILSNSGCKNSYLFFSSYLYKISKLSLKSFNSSENHTDWYIKLAKKKIFQIFTGIDKMVCLGRILDLF